MRKTVINITIGNTFFIKKIVRTVYTKKYTLAHLRNTITFTKLRHTKQLNHINAKKEYFNRFRILFISYKLNIVDY